MNPTVSVVMLCSPGRDQMRLRAIRSIEAQTYQPIQFITHESRPGATIGQLRNEACAKATGDIIVTADDDDWSAPQRIAEQVALLQASGADCVGYREALFYDTRPGQFCGAWIYRSPDTSYAIGASLAFWRKTWERVPFDPKLPDGRCSEDWKLVKSVKTLGIGGVTECVWSPDGIVAPGVVQQGDVWDRPPEPRLICGIHGANSASYDKFSAHTWKRAANWDEYCRAKMELK